ncbi:MAG: hypothetical protein OET90_11595, partial [Desulfuromonadales bacterium]|nr:hypothetical protein [Desulfuromonadales bacterium]
MSEQNFRIVTYGELAEGFDRQSIEAALAKLCKYSPERLSKVFSGEKFVFKSNVDSDTAKRYQRALGQTGIICHVEAMPATAPKQKASTPKLASKPSRRKLKLFLFALVALLLILLISASFLWRGLHRPLPAEVTIAEDALFDGNLLAIGHIDVEKLVFLDRFWMGELDPNALPLDNKQLGLLSKLFSGPARLKENVRQVVFSMSGASSERPGGAVLLASGAFEAQPLLSVLGESYQLEEVAASRWRLSSKDNPEAELPCENKMQPKEALDNLFVQISPEWLMLYRDPVQGDRIWQRLSSNQAAEQDVEEWRRYRRDKLFSFMAIAPVQASEALGGLSGMVAKKAASDAPELTAAAVGVDVAVFRVGLTANLRLLSQDEVWNSNVESEIATALKELMRDSRSVSPVLSDLISQIVVARDSKGIDVYVPLDPQLLDDLDQVGQDVFSHLFSSGMSDDEVVEEGIDKNPPDYSPEGLTRLAPYEPQGHETSLLFHEKSFAVDLRTIRFDKEGVLQLVLEGKVGFSKGGEGMSKRGGEFSFSVASVKDANGQELLRDERCMSRSELGGRSPNLDAETRDHHFGDSSSVEKYVRLKPDVTAEQIAAIEGELSFSGPARVRKFEAVLRAGEVIEHAGMRFY